MANLLHLPTFASKTAIHVVVETPRHAQAKFKYEPKLGIFMLSRALALGLSYPYDWGFVPSTSAPDGDPIDALVMHNVTTSPGVVLRCNDRLVVVPMNSSFQPGASDVRDLPASLRDQAEEFFVAATAGTGKTLKFLGWRGPGAQPWRRSDTPTKRSARPAARGNGEATVGATG